MPRRPKTPPRTNAQLQRELRGAETRKQFWIDRYNRMQINWDMARAREEQARRQMLEKDVEIGRLQGYIDRVLDEDRVRQGSIVEGPTRPPDRAIEALRRAVASGDQSLDELSPDEIERLTGRDDEGE